MVNLVNLVNLVNPVNLANLVNPVNLANLVFIISALTAPRLVHAGGPSQQAAVGSSAQRRAQSPPPVSSPRLYVFDGGTLDVADTGRFQLKRDEIATDKLSVACFLVVHPRGTLMWDGCAVPDGAWKTDGTPQRVRIALPDAQERFVAIVKPLVEQLAQAGYAPADITDLALSHYHYDHTANANAFARARWLVRSVEHDAMFAARPPDLTQPASYAALRNSRTVIIRSDEYDVFGDRTVVIKLAPGHTPGHQVLYVKLAKTGGVVLSGDLYHYPEERALGRVPTFEFNKNQTVASRVVIDAFLKKTGADLWIQHDFTGNAKLRKAPAYYE